MAKRNESTELQKNRRRVREAESAIRGSPLSHVLSSVHITETDACKVSCLMPNNPEFGSRDPKFGSRAIIGLNVVRNYYSVFEWTYAICHQLAHLSLNHHLTKNKHKSYEWIMAREYAADSLLNQLRIVRYSPPDQFMLPDEFRNKGEELIYNELTCRFDRIRLYTLAGERDDIYMNIEPKIKYDELFAKGIKESLNDAIESVIFKFEGTIESKNKNLILAKKWIMNDYPVFGALMSHLRIISDRALCERMNISVGAVNPNLGEIYINPKWNLSEYEMRFLLMHEIMHVALMHGQRRQGREHEAWNFAADFVINSWLLDMNVGTMPRMGGCYDPRLRGMKAEQIYDMIMADPKFRKGLKGFRGELGDIIYEGQAQKLYRGDVITIDDIVKRSLAAGLEMPGRGFIPAELIEEIKSLFTPPVPWNVELGRWMEEHVPIVREKRRTYARLSRRQSSTPDIPRPALHIPIELKEACVFGVVLDTSISMDRELLGYALGAIASYSEAREVHAIRLISCDAKPYDHGFIEPTELRGLFSIQGRGGTALQPGISYLINQKDFPSTAPIMIITDGYCETNLHVPREHCFVMPKGQYIEDGKRKKTKIPLVTTAPTFRILKE